MAAKTFAEIAKFNPYHDAKGRFASADSAASFTYAPGKSTAHDAAIQRGKEADQKGTEKGFKGTLYHGSPATDIEEFDMRRAGENTSSGERLLFFTDSKQMAEDFSYERLEGSSKYFQRRGKKGRVYEVEVEMKNPLDLRNLTDKDIDNILQLDVDGILTKDMVKMYAQKNHQLLKSGLELTAESLKSLGYDGLIANTGKAGHNSLEYAVVDSKQAKIRKAAPTAAKTFSEVLKFNPYHDQLGRFASSSGGGGALDGETAEYLRAYTAGKYSAACTISQEIAETGGCDNYIEQAKNGKLGFGKAESLEKDIKQTEAIMQAISGSPTTGDELVRLEIRRNNHSPGDEFVWGIRSTSADKAFAEKVYADNDEGLHTKYEVGTKLGLTEYRIVGDKKALNIEEYSEFDQLERLVQGKFRVKSVQEIEFTPDNGIVLADAIKQDPTVAERYVPFTSKSGKQMVRDIKTGRTFTEAQTQQKVLFEGELEDKDFVTWRNEQRAKNFVDRTVVVVEQIFD